MKPKTILTIDEERIRSYQHCSEFFSFGGRVTLPIKTSLTEYIYIQMILDLLKEQNFDFKFSLNKHMNKAIRTLISKDCKINLKEELKRHVTINIDDIFKLLQPRVYVPVFGPFEYPVKVSDSVININIAAMLATNADGKGSIRTRTYHAVTFSPFNRIQDIENDIVQVIKLLTLADANPLAMKEHTSRLKLHIFSTKNSSAGVQYTSMDYTSRTNKNIWSKYITNYISMIESGNHIPTLPCPNRECIYQERCTLSPVRRSND